MDFPSLDDLKRETDTFFHRHWVTAEIGAAPPKWESSPSRFTGSIPNYNKGGCYALIEGGTVVYIGVGTRLGAGRYTEHGISLRLLSHVIHPVGEGRHEPRERWSSVTEILTIGFDPGQTYLAPSLEDYLIGKLSPCSNSNKRRGTSASDQEVLS